MNTDENSVLVEYSGNTMIRIVRVYLSARRAEEDRALLEQVHPGSDYRVTTVEFIDN